jgi:carbonic anhydrase/acetyltransferase-like protein (isoleucine patch superfamily)
MVAGRKLMPEAPEIHVAGTGSFALEVVEYALAAGRRIAGLVELLDAGRVGTAIHGLPVHAVDDLPPGGMAVVGAGGDRARHWATLAAEGWRAATIVHPSAWISPSAELAPGCVVGPATVVGAATRLGGHVLVGRGALVGHHTLLEAGVVLNPGANVAGHVRIGPSAVIGMGARVADHIAVGARAGVAAGAGVVRAVGEGVRVQGVPARPFGGESG